MITMYELHHELSQATLIPPREQLFDLYKVYLKLEGIGHDDFDQFLQWAPRAMADFNVVESYLLDGAVVFRDLRAIKEIEDWSFLQSELSASQRSFMAHWDMLGKLYQAWIEHCKATGQAFTGQLAKLAAHNYLSSEYQVQFEKLYFVAINALTRAEERLVYQLVGGGRAEILWDADQYYVDDNSHEAGFFLRRHQDALGKLHNLRNNLRAAPPKVTITQCSTIIGQVKAAAEILANIPNPGPETAIVMADESLLIPMLNSLPQGLKVNITLGLPLKGSLVVDLLNVLIKIAEDKDTKAVYFRHMRSIVNNPLLASASDKDLDFWEALEKRIEKHNIVRISKDDLPADNQLARLICESIQVTDYQTLEKVFAQFTDDILEGDIDELSRSQVILARNTVEDVVAVCRSKETPLSIDSFVTLVNTALHKASVSFISEPVEGVQILGVLESRALDFEHVIIVGANEGALPSSPNFDSYIPFDVRRQLGLPGKEEQDAIFAYYFYRLFHRSTQVDILTTSEQPRMGMMEPSRYVAQVIHELPADIEIRQWNMSLPDVAGVEFAIPSSDKIREAVVARLQKGISPSALNTFIECPLDFYFKYALGLYEPSEVEESLEHSGFGTVVHETLDHFYRPLEGKELTLAHIDSWRVEIDNVVRMKLTEQIQASAIGEGANLLAFEAAKKYVRRFMRMEKDWLEECRKTGQKVEIVRIEQELRREIALEGITIKLRGFADRIDRVGGKLRIVDYKTGIVKSGDLRYESVEKIVDSTKTKLAQILMYGYCALEDYDEDLSMGMISFRALKDRFIPAVEKKTELGKEDVEQIFPSLLSHLFHKMMAEDFVWSHRDKARYCVYCSGQGFEPKRKF